MINFKIGDKVRCIEEVDNYKVGNILSVVALDSDGDPILSGDTEQDIGWVHWREYFEPCDDEPATDKALDLVNHPTGGLSGHYLADVEKPQRGGIPYRAECDDIIYALNMTFDEGEAFKAIWRTCTARLGYGKKDNTPLYNAQKLVHRSKRILQRAESETGE